MENEAFENHFKYFLAKNERRMNGFFRRILWYSCFVGPAIAVGVLCDAFPDVTYWACLQTLLITLAFAIGHSVLYKYMPESHLIKYLGLIGALIVIFIMSINHIDVYLCYFFVPMTSLLYCSRKTYVMMSALSFLVLLFGNWRFAGYLSGMFDDIDTFSFFANIAGGQTIEFLLMFLSGYFINMLMIKHLQTMYCDEVAISKSEHEVYSDPLTGLWNRRYIEKAFEKYVVVQRNVGSLVVVDLDNLKHVNDTYGHLEGDAALKIMGDILRKTFDKSEFSTICRFGGDEFVILLPGIQSVSALSLCMSQLFAHMDESFSRDVKLKELTLSVGAAFINDLDMDYEMVFGRADKAMYEVKNNGRNSFQIYSDT